MARTGITYEEVAKVAHQLKEAGQSPTVDRVREVLGTGSKSTILPFLRQWRALEFNTSEDLLENLPYSLLSTFVDTWKQVNKTTDARIEALNQQNQQEIDFLKEAFIQLQNEKDTLQTQSKQERDKNQILRLENADLESALRHEQQEHTKLRDRYTLQAQHLEESKIKNKALHAVVERFQTNLEHYQQANQELQLHYNLTLEKQQGEFQRERSELLQQIRTYQEQKQALETELQVKNESLKAYQTLQDEHHRLVGNYHGQQQELTIINEKYRQLEKTYQQQIKISQETMNERVELQKQTLLSAERLSSLVENLNQMKAMVVTLKEEKQELLQIIKSIKAPVEQMQ